MLGAIAGDIIGSRFEWNNLKSKDFELFTDESSFTDDSVLTVALADSLMSGTPFVDKLKEYYRLYPDRGYGGRFHSWARGDSSEPYNSFGNGSAEVTHNHPEGIKGAQAVAAGIFLLRTGATKVQLRDFYIERFAYDLQRTCDQIRPGYTFDVTCQGSVPEAIIAFLEAADFEDSIRNAVSLGGDSDTIAAVTGSLAEAHFGSIPGALKEKVFARLDERLTAVARSFIKAVGRG